MNSEELIARNLLGMLNFWVIQWLCIRIAVCIEETDAGPEMCPKVGSRVVGYALLKVWPLSGYFGWPFLYWGETQWIQQKNHDQIR